jgi:hypothetical protein
MAAVVLERPDLFRLVEALADETGMLPPSWSSDGQNNRQVPAATGTSGVRPHSAHEPS